MKNQKLCWRVRFLISINATGTTGLSNAFTATQIPFIDDRKYPAELCGKMYPKGIPIYPEEMLLELIRKNKIDEVVFSYSDVTFNYVMTKAAMINAEGVSFKMLGYDQTKSSNR
jgi:predicted GTPase